MVSIYFFNNAQKNEKGVYVEDKTISLTQTSKEYAVMGGSIWSAFECSSLASFIDDLEEQDRLFSWGYEQGKIFIEALNRDQIKQEDISKEVPIGVILLLQGPSSDFILGRIYEVAQDNALEDVFMTGENYNSDEIQKIAATNKFGEANCNIIGK